MLTTKNSFRKIMQIPEIAFPYEEFDKNYTVILTYPGKASV